MPQLPPWNLPNPRSHRKDCRPGNSWWSERRSSHTFSRTLLLRNRKCLSISRSRTITLTVRQYSVTRTICSNTWHRASLAHARAAPRNSLRTSNHHRRQRLHPQVSPPLRYPSACPPSTPTQMHSQTIMSLSPPAIFYQQRSSYSNNHCRPQIRIKLNNLTGHKLNCQLRLRKSFNCIHKDPVTQSWNHQRKPHSLRRRRRNSRYCWMTRQKKWRQMSTTSR